MVVDLSAQENVLGCRWCGCSAEEKSCGVSVWRVYVLEHGPQGVSPRSGCNGGLLGAEDLINIVLLRFRTGPPLWSRSRRREFVLVCLLDELHFLFLESRMLGGETLASAAILTPLASAPAASICANGS